MHIERDDAPDTLEYSVDVVVPETVYTVRMRLGFRVEARVSVYLRQVVEDLVAAGKLDLRSGYPSLRTRDIPGDFRFILLHRVFSASSTCTATETFLMRWHERLRRISYPEISAYGLDTSLVDEESVPLILNNTPPRRIQRV